MNGLVNDMHIRFYLADLLRGFLIDWDAKQLSKSDA